MKHIIISLLLLFLSTSINASGNFEKYLSMKKETYLFYENKNSKKAYELVSSFIKKYPKDIRAKNLLAVLYYWDGDFLKSKSILLEILKNNTFKQSSTLLKRIEKKYIKKSIKVTKNSKNITADVKYFHANIKKDPKDVISRKVLANYYNKIGKKTEAEKLAMQVLKLDPDDRDMLIMLGKRTDVVISDDRLNKATSKLHSFYKNKKYNNFMNLYNSLENNKVLMATYIHVEALFSSLELQNYEKAKSILYYYRMPKNKNIDKVKKMIDQKLSKNDCNSEICMVKR